MGINQSKYNVLVCPLDWGLGHVSRIIPILNRLLQNNCKLYISCSRSQFLFLQQENIPFEWIPCSSPEIKYKARTLNAFDLLALVPRIYAGIVRDRKHIKQWIKKYNIHLIISDSRFGCYHKKIPSVVITHQINMKLPPSVSFFEPILSWHIKKRIRKFRYCWVPDIPSFPNFAGDLSLNHNLSVQYIGILSRFEKAAPSLQATQYEYEALGIISGPEPQRSIFAQLLLSQMKQLPFRCGLVMGKPDYSKTPVQDNNVTIFPFASSTELYQLILSSKYIVARAGYSTIMDLIALQRTAILVPTPGQTEQEYLANYYQTRKTFVVSTQENLKLDKALEELSVYTFNYQYTSNHLLDNAIEKIIAEIEQNTHS